MNTDKIYPQVDDVPEDVYREWLNTTGFATGKLQEDTQYLLDKYNELYNWSYNDMCDYIKLHGESKFQNATTEELYETIYGD